MLLWLLLAAQSGNQSPSSQPALQAFFFAIISHGTPYIFYADFYLTTTSFNTILIYFKRLSHFRLSELRDL